MIGHVRDPLHQSCEQIMSVRKKVDQRQSADGSPQRYSWFPDGYPRICLFMNYSRTSSIRHL